MILKTKTVYLLLGFMLTSGLSFAEAKSLSSHSPELKHLLSAGYKVIPGETNSEVTVLRNDKFKLAVVRNENLLSLYRVFGPYKNLDEKKELRLLRTINKINETLPYRVSLRETALYFVVNDLGVYDKDSFSYLLQIMESVNGLIVKYPELSNLINNQ